MKHACGSPSASTSLNLLRLFPPPSRHPSCHVQHQHPCKRKKIGRKLHLPPPTSLPMLSRPLNARHASCTIMLHHPSSRSTMQVMIEVSPAPILEALVSSVFLSRMCQLATHEKGNYVAQCLLGRITSAKQVRGAMCSLTGMRSGRHE